MFWNGKTAMEGLSGSGGTEAFDDAKTGDAPNVLAGQWCSRSTRAATDFADCKNMLRPRPTHDDLQIRFPSHVILSRYVRQAPSNRVNLVSVSRSIKTVAAESVRT